MTMTEKEIKELRARQIEAELRSLERDIIKRIKENRLEIYNTGSKVHKKQIEFHKDPHRIKVLFGGNRTGKTVGGAVESVCHAIGYSRFRELKPSSGWVVSFTNEVQRDVAQKEILRWLPKKEIKDLVIRHGRKDDPENSIIDKIILKNGQTIGFKTVEQGREAFQGTSQGWIWIDEEPPEEIYKECKMRLIDTRGDMWITMTPLKGLCFDEKTEILTENGWCKWNEIKLGDKAVTFNMDTEKLEWDEIKGLYCNKNYSGEMVHMVNNAFDAFVTPNHRWPVYSKSKEGKPEIVLTKDLKPCHYFKNAAEFVDFPKEKTYPDEFCELAGWVVGDGSFLKGKRYVKLYQSLTKYPEKCERIRYLLNALNAEWTEKQYPYSGFSPNGIACHFTISGKYAELLRECLPNKELSMSFLRKLTKEQLWMLYDGLMKSDGSQDSNGDRFKQIKESVVSSLQMLCVLLGLKSTVKCQKNNRSKNRFVYQTYIQRSKHFSPNTYYNSLKIDKVNYNGLIWCAQTNNTTLVAKRNGTVYITGNTWAYTTLYLNEANDPNITYWFMEWDDNPWLSQEEIQSLIATMPGEEREARQYGRFVALCGLAFPELRKEVHIRKPLMVTPDWYKRYVALDYGFDALASIWVMIDNYGKGRIYKALYKENLIISEAAKAILKFNGNDRIEAYYAPPDLWNRRQDTGKSAAQIFYENGITLVKVSNDREQGWLNVHEWLKPYEVRDEQTGEVYKTANLTIDEGVDPLLWKCLTIIQKDEKNPNDVATEPHKFTHYPDALRYFCVSRLVPSRQPQPEKKYNFEFEKKKEKNYTSYFGGEPTEEYFNYGG